MNIDLNAQAQSLLNANIGPVTGASSNSSSATTGLPAFSQLLSSQVKVFQNVDAKYTINRAQLLSPHIEQATEDGR